MHSTVDVLMITHRRPEYVKLSLPRLLESLPPHGRVWLWHNGEDEQTLEVVRSFLGHPRIAHFRHSPENVGLRTPTNWLWANSEADFISKVDDDCLVDPRWITTLLDAHKGAPETGVLGSWRFYDEDYMPRRAEKKLRQLANGTTLLQNHWVQGSSYLARRTLLEEIGPIAQGESFPDWCIRAARAGRVNGWVFPFVHEEHMDDPRSPWTMFTDDAAFMAHRPLSAAQTGVTTTAGWTRQMKRSARVLQTASLDIRRYTGWRRRLLNARIRASDLTLRAWNGVSRGALHGHGANE
ncbi:hypothetical protein GCM10027411_19370 [Microbacterium aureliae]